MVQQLKKEDLDEAVNVYYKGLKMEIPLGLDKKRNIKKRLEEINCFVHKTNNKIDGLITFIISRNNIKLDFICVMKLRKGIGKQLMKKVAKYAIKNKYKKIYSNVSSQDKRVLSFYNRLGFKKYSSYKAGRNFLLYKIKANTKDIILP